MPKLTSSSAVHHFSTNVANRFGVLEAILLYNIEYWVSHNTVKKKNYKNGKYWTYNSIPAFQKQFFYLSQKQIKRALMNLRVAGILYAEERGQNPMDRTLWYSINYEMLAEVEAAELILDDEPFEDETNEPDGLIDDTCEPNRQDQMGFSTIYKYKQTNSKPNIGVQNEIFTHPLQEYERQLGIKIPKKLTNEEATKLEDEFGIEPVKDVLESLANYKKQNQYTSVYLTVKKWIKKDLKDKPGFHQPIPDLSGVVIR